MTENEVWKDVVGYEGLYKVSDRGNVHSVVRKDSIGSKCGGRILKPNYDKDGYLNVNLCNNGKVKTKKIHRLVAEAFLPNPNGLPQINHIDEIKDNNNVENLEWCTSKYNLNHGTRTERVVKIQSKKVRAVNIKTGKVLSFNSTVEAGRKGYDQGGVAAACKGAYKDNRTGKLIGGDGRTYRGHRWSYEKVVPK